VREVISYLKICQNPHSDIDLLNIINVPPRRISDQTLHIITSYQQRNEITLWSALERCSNIVLLSETQKQPILHFVAKIKEVRNSLNSLSVAELIELILKNFGLHSYYKNDKQRLYFWDQLKKQEAIFAGSLSEYLERIVLQKEPDVYEPHAEKVTLMTLHAAKGLEFSVVFIAGCEEDLIPYRRKNEAIENLEEERRLFYVGMTRAKHRLLLLRADSRFLFGERKSNRPSRFLNDIEQALKENREAQLKEKKLRDQTDKTDRSQMSLF